MSSLSKIIFLDFKQTINFRGNGSFLRWPVLITCTLIGRGHYYELSKIVKINTHRYLSNLIKWKNMFKPNLIIGLQKTKGSHSINCNIKEKKKRLFTCLNFIYVKGKE